MENWRVNLPTNKAVVFLGVAHFFVSCSSGPAPLAIKMVNPKTNQTLDCHAKEPTGRTDRDLLAAAVENCAKQLEAHGFIREK